MAKEEPSDKLAKLQNEQPKGVHIMSLTLFNKRTNKTTKLINNEDPADFVKSQSRQYSFDLRESIFVQRIEVNMAVHAGFKAEFGWKNLRGNTTKKERISNSKNKFVIVVNDFLSEFYFKPDKLNFSEAKITNVSVFGLTHKELNESLLDISRIDAYKNDIIDLCEEKIEESNQAVADLGGLTEEKNIISLSITELQTSQSGLEDAISELRVTRSETQETISQKTTEEGEIQSRIDQLEDSIDAKSKQSQSLNQEIIDRDRELKQLKNDINLFPTEVRSFVTQGARNISRYSILAFLPIVILTYVTWYLFNNGAEFAKTFSMLPTADIWSVFLARIPFVAVSLGIISACYKLAEIFIAEVIKINTQRLNLSKISIIAKDVSIASEHGLDLSEEERYEFQTKLKMDLLRTHLKGYIDDGYSYRTSPAKTEKKGADGANGHTSNESDE